MNKSMIITTLAFIATVGTAQAAETRVDSKAMVGADSTVRQVTGTASAAAGTRDASAMRATVMAGAPVGMGWAGSSTATN